MHPDSLTVPDLDIPFAELELEDLPTIDELLRDSPVTLSPPPTAGQTTFTERICIRINRGVLDELKRQAAEQGTRYQTFINLILAERAAA